MDFYIHLTVSIAIWVIVFLITKSNNIAIVTMLLAGILKESFDVFIQHETLEMIDVVGDLAAFGIVLLIRKTVFMKVFSITLPSFGQGSLNLQAIQQNGKQGIGAAFTLEDKR